MQDQVQNVGALKIKCISEFMKYLKATQKGYYKNYDYILNMMCFINSYNQLDNKKLITQYLLNNV